MTRMIVMITASTPNTTPTAIPILADEDIPSSFEVIGF
jgi:hypothetical protein